MSPQFDGLAASRRLAFVSRRRDRLATRFARRFASGRVALMGNGAKIHNFTHRIKKELSICQSSLCLDLVSFPVLSQIKPQAPAGSAASGCAQRGAALDRLAPTSFLVKHARRALPLAKAGFLPPTISRWGPTIS
jgi:hypothetical protein